jgi:hypothetical protein
LTGIDRRELLAALAAAVSCRALGTPAHAGSHALPLYVSCRNDAEGRSSVAVFSLDGGDLFSTVLPSRGHDIVARPGGTELVVFARRPGNWAVVLDLAYRRIAQTILAREDRHFYGHGAFSADGRLLLASENNADTGDGLLGIYDATDGYRRMGEIGSRGIGPHDLKLLPDRKTLAVANGGLRTLPDRGAKC